MTGFRNKTSALVLTLAIVALAFLLFQPVSADESTPIIVSLSPNQGNQGETMDTTITGSNFTGITIVSFGAGISVNSYSVDNSTQITANITINEAATTGSRDISVTNTAGTGVLTAGFTIPTATISGVSPNSANQGQALDVVITGSNLGGATLVDFGAGITVTSFIINSPTQITASITIIGTATPGARNISVTTPGGVATLTDGFTVNQASPAISNVSPNQGIQGQTLSSVTLTGTYFTGATSLDFGSGITATIVSIDSSTQITANITISGSAAPGSRNISVTTPGGTGTLTSGFTINQAPPTLSSVSPNQGIQGQALSSVTLTGTYLTGAISVSFGSGITVNSLTVNSPTQIIVSITINPAAVPGTRSITVTTPGGSSAPLANAFTVNPAPPTLSLVSPNQGIQGQTLSSVTLTGTYLSGATSVSFGTGITVNSLTVNSPTQITANITIDPAAAPGARSVTVTTPGGSSAPLANAFTVNPAPPTITGVSPNQGIQGQTLSSVTLTGTYLTGVTSVSFGSGITVNSLTVNSPTQITANITIDPAAAPGARSVTVTTPGGSSAPLANAFTVNPAPPTITGVSPNQGIQGQTLSSVTLTGTYFTGATSVSFGSGITVNSLTVNSPTQITASITINPTAAPGARSVTVTTPGGSSAPLANAFTVNQAPPTISLVSPNQGIQGQTLSNVILTGTYLTGATSVDFGSGITATIVNIDSPTQITASITIDGTAAEGTRIVSINTPGGTATLPGGFTVTAPVPVPVPPPTITGVSPDSADQDQALDVVITGSNLSGAITVDFGAGITVTSFTVNSSTQITANITIDPAAAPGARSITVTAPGGSSAPLANAFTVNPAPPTVTSINPNQGIQGQTLNGVIITGTYLTGATSIDFGSGITATIVSIDSPTQITASLTIDGNAAEGTRIVSINTPDGTATLPGGFTVTVPVPVPIPPPTITGVSLASGFPGEKLTIIITGVNLDGVFEVSLGDGIRVESFTVDSPTQITATITIDQTATVGLRNVSVTTASDTATLSDSFNIQAQQTSNASSAWLWLGIVLVSLLLVFMFVVTRPKKPVERHTIIDPQDPRWQRRPRPSHTGLFLKPRK